MTVAISILLAAVVGGVIFTLLDNWQRRETVPTPAAPRTEPYTWQQPAATVPLAAPRPAPPAAPSPLWSGWASHRPEGEAGTSSPSREPGRDAG